LGVSLERVGQAQQSTENFASWHIPAPHILTPFVSGQVDSLETLLGFDETEYLALFLWLAVAGRFSIDRMLNRSLRA
jgi:putative oxidoreductase